MKVTFTGGRRERRRARRLRAGECCVTAAGGNVTFTYHDTNVVGDDTIRASFTDPAGLPRSATAVQHWVRPPSGTLRVCAVAGSEVSVGTSFAFAADGGSPAGTTLVTSELATGTAVVTIGPDVPDVTYTNARAPRPVVAASGPPPAGTPTPNATRAPTVTSTVSFGWSVTRSRLTLTRLLVAAPPKGAVVTLVCSGTGCPLKSKTTTLVSRKRIDVLKALTARQRAFRAKQRLELRIAAPASTPR